MYNYNIIYEILLIENHFPNGKATIKMHPRDMALMTLIEMGQLPWLNGC